jgi:hypothetical protein
VKFPQQYAHSVAWGLDGDTEATEMFVILFPRSIQVVFRKLEDGLCASAGLTKLVFVSRGTGDYSCLHYHNKYCSSQVSVHSNAHEVIAGFFLSPDPEVT